MCIQLCNTRPQLMLTWYSVRLHLYTKWFCAHGVHSFAAKNSGCSEVNNNSPFNILHIQYISRIEVYLTLWQSAKTLQNVKFAEIKMLQERFIMVLYRIKSNNRHYFLLVYSKGLIIKVFNKIVFSCSLWNLEFQAHYKTEKLNNN